MCGLAAAGEGSSREIRYVPDREGAGDAVNLVLATDRDWFASALEGVLEAESYRVRRAEGIEEVLDELRAGGGDVLVLDDHLAGEETPEVVARLLAGPTSRDIPLLVYSSSLSDDLFSEVLEAGAWDVIEGPIRAARVLPRIRRWLQISGRHRRELNEASRDAGAGLPSLDGLLQRLPVVEALARREEASIAVMAVGLTGSGSRDGDEGQRRRIADLCVEGLRKSDLCGWLDAGDELAVVAYSATREGARVLAERLAEMAADRLEMTDPREALSAGIVELRPDDLPEEVRAEDRADTQVEILARARAALEEAREQGGGVRFAS